jgi:hypothetical protein
METNDFLYLKKLKALLLENRASHIDTGLYYQAMSLDENHFTETVAGLVKKKAVEIGTGSKTKFIKIHNWQQKPLKDGGLLIRITKNGKKMLEQW